MQPRIEGATLPGFVCTVTDDNGNAISDGLSYAWVCQASLDLKPAAAVQIWQKSGITATASGFVCTWLPADIGALTAVNGFPTTYTLEFTGTNGTNILKHQEACKILQQIAG